MTEQLNLYLTRLSLPAHSPFSRGTLASNPSHAPSHGRQNSPITKKWKCSQLNVGQWQESSSDLFILLLIKQKKLRSKTMKKVDNGSRNLLENNPPVRASLVAQLVRYSPAMQKTQI